MRKASAVDANQSELVDALRKFGATVTPTHATGAGFPDLVVGYQGVNYLLEIKDGAKPASARKLT
jgi:Holliday junction resolvase